MINFIHIPKNGGSSIKDICNNKLKYHGHSANARDGKIKNQLIIIRNPIDRFVSAVYYTLEKWSHEPQIRYLIENNINTPEKWIEIWSNPHNEHYRMLMFEMLNRYHRIGNVIIPYKWVYSPQSFWINNPQYVIIMDNLDDEMKYLMKKIGIDMKIPHNNKTKKSSYTLSQKSKDFLYNFYKKDFILYEKYKKIPLEERIKIDDLLVNK